MAAINKTDRKKISDKDGSPCNTCLVKSICTKSLLDNTICKEYMIFILREVKRCTAEAKKINYKDFI